MKSPITLLEALTSWFEKNELIDGEVSRLCPMPSEEVAQATYRQWLDELVRWKGSPVSLEQQGAGQRAQWPDLRIKQQGRGIGIWIDAWNVWQQWSRPETWQGDPLKYACSWEWEVPDDPNFDDDQPDD